MLENLLEHLMKETRSMSPPTMLEHLNETDVEDLAELFIEAK